MRPHRHTCAGVVAAVVFVGSRGVLAQAPQGAADAQALRQEIDQLRREFEALKQQYDQRLTALETRLSGLQEQPAPAPAAAPASDDRAGPAGAEGAGGPAGALPVYGSAVTGSKVFNPDIAVIGDFLGATGPNPVSPDPALALHESEASFQAVVDPYARADFFLVVRRGRRRCRGRVHHLHVAARRPADEGRQDARGLRQGQHAAQPRAAVDRSSARDEEPGRRRGRHQRCRHLGRAADSQPMDLSRSDGTGLPRRFGRDTLSRPASAAT